jgi:hypothetical protein
LKTGAEKGEPQNEYERSEIYAIVQIVEITSTKGEGEDP